MSYLLRSKKPNRRGGKFKASLFLIIFIFVIIFHSSIVKSISYFGLYFGNAIDSIMPQGFKYAKALAEENESLKKQINFLVAENADRNILSQENDKLKAGYGRTDKELVLYTPIITRPPNSPYDTFLLDTGGDNRVVKGQVVVFGRVAIGEVDDVSGSVAKAKLYSSPGNTFDAVLGENTPIKVKGLGGGSFEALVPIGVDVSEGESIVMPSISSKIFGLVQKIEEKQSEGFNRILFSMPINPNQIDALAIVIK